MDFRQLVILLLAMMIAVGCKSSSRKSEATDTGSQASPTAATQLYPALEGGRWGFVNAMGKIVIPARYDGAGHFYEGLARVKQGRRWGWIDSSGKMVIRPRFEEAGDFSDGLAWVCGVEEEDEEEERERERREGKEPKEEETCGYVNTKGDLVVKPVYPEGSLHNFSEGRASVPEGDKFGFIDRTGKKVIPAIYERVGSFSDGLASVRVDNKYGYVTADGKTAIPLQYHYAGLFTEGCGLVRIGLPPNVDWGMIDKKGNLLFRLQADELWNLSENRARFRKGDKWGFVDRTGNAVIPPQYDFAFDFKEGLAAVRTGMAWGYIGPEGQVVIQPQFNSAEQFKNGIAYVSFPGGWGYVNKSGEYVWKIMLGAPPKP